MDIRGYYAILGISQDANFQEIKNPIENLQKISP
jgi:DnaJ-class molecular chaperone